MDGSKTSDWAVSTRFPIVQTGMWRENAAKESVPESSNGEPQGASRGQFDNKTGG